MTGRLRLLSLREQTEAVGEDMDRERLRFDALKGAERTRAVSSFNLFQTPEPLAAEMVQRTGLTDGMRVLEPSAGLGRIYRAIRARSDAHVTLVEQSVDCCGELYREIDERARLVQADFLACDVERLGTFDRIVMNPPFKQGRDIRHIRHAFDLLNPGGVLVALCYAGVRQRKAFSEVWGWTDLPADTFKTEGTRAAVALLTIRK